MTEVWQKYGGGFVWIRSIRKKVNLVWYVLKYVNKTLDVENEMYAAILFASNKRMFSMSQNLMTMLNIRRNRKEEGWTYEGTVDELTVEVFCRDEHIPFEDIIQVEATTDMYYKYPLIFDVWDPG